MNEPVKVTFAQAKKIITKVFPEAKSRRPVRVEGKETYHCEDYWSGGSRNEARFIDMISGNVASSADIPREARQVAGNGYNLPVADIKMTPQFLVVEHCIFTGKDLGFRLYVHPSVLERLTKALETGEGMLELPAVVA